MKLPTGLRSLEDALEQLLQASAPVSEVESISTFDADGRVLALDLVSPLDVPGFDNSQMDGYAVRAADVSESGTLLQVSQRIAAGHFGVALEPQTAARIFTGAPMPSGADCVVMQEDCEVVNEVQGGVRIKTVPTRGQWVRLRGEDVRVGQISLQKGELFSPAALGLAASLGFEKLSVYRKVRVALFSTGDELVMPGEVAPQDMKLGAIYNSNRFFLRTLLVRAGCQVTDLGIVPDSRAATLEALQNAAQKHDLILTSGGVSVGEEDHIKPAVEQLGSLDLWSISMKPGKPFAYGRVRREDRSEAHFVGLPGNPVSSFVTFLLLVKPMLEKLQGQRGPFTALNSIAAPAGFKREIGDKRREFLRARRTAQGILELFPNQNSSVLSSCVWADGLVDLAAGQTVSEGDMLRFIPFSNWF